MSSGRAEARIALVTGAGRGLGRAYAQRLAADGFKVVLTDRDDSTVEPKEKIVADGGEAWDIACDVSDPSDVEGLAAEVDRLGGADVLVHNAGIYPLTPFEEITLEDWRRVMAVNLDSMFLLSQAFLPHMKERGWGRIVGVSTGMFHGGHPGALHYVSSKGGIVGFVRSLAPEIGPLGITVNAVSPGLIQTDGTKGGGFPELFELALQLQSVKRKGQPSDLAGVVSFLVSDDASFINGQTLLVDGGMSRL